MVSGLISETAPTNVVLPTPNPPATTIFVDVRPTAGLEPAKSTENPFEQVEVRLSLVEVRWWRRTSPSSAMSAMSTRATPSGTSSSAEISATDRK